MKIKINISIFCIKEKTEKSEDSYLKVNGIIYDVVFYILKKVYW
jgi:hypothetical protein